MLATLRDRPPAGDAWVHEIKFDGYRFQLHLRSGGSHLYTRRGHDWTGRARTIAAAARELKADIAIIDGEVVVEAPDGTTDFNELERELGRKDSARLTLYVFDLLYVDGWDLRGAGLLARKRVLAELIRDLSKSSPIKFSEHMEADGAEMQRQACKLGLEGIVSKRKDGLQFGSQRPMDQDAVSPARHLRDCRLGAERHEV
jgi:bifunctional non-homologous end joining protein LigD